MTRDAGIWNGELNKEFSSWPFSEYVIKEFD